jgi:hypothetical protein
MARKKSNVDPDAPPKKRGQPSNFAGTRLEFLKSKLPEYIAASKLKGTPQARTEGLTVFWPKLFQKYCEKYPWDLPLNQEPDPNALPPPPPQTAEEVFTSLGLNLSPEEEERKGKIQKEMKGVSHSLTRYRIR